jgi:hypothetical protein
MATNKPRIAINMRRTDIAIPLGVLIKIGMSAMGNHSNCAGNHVIRAMALRFRNFSTSQIEGI